MSEIEAKKRRLSTLITAYMHDPDFLEAEYRLPPLKDLLPTREDALGVARFIELPSFEPERLFTLIYTPSAVHIEAVVGAESLWASLPWLCQTQRSDGTLSELQEVGNSAFVPKDAWRGSAVLSLSAFRCPKPLRSWQSLKATAVAAVSCKTYCFDGIVYRHRVCDRDCELFAEWSNPTKRWNSEQFRLIHAYVKLLRHAALYSSPR